MLGRSLLTKASGARLLYPGYVQVLLDRITAADVGSGNTQGLEVGVTDAINTCVQALVADGILGVSGGALAQAASLVKASCLMQGARTLSGSLVPLAADMPAPSSFGFGAPDYSRRTGLIGDGVGKFLISNRFVNSDPQNHCHLGAYVTQADTRNQAGTFPGLIGVQRGGSPFDGNALFYNPSGGTLVGRTRSTGLAQVFPTRATTGFSGVSRASSTQETVRGNGVSTTVNTTSTPSENNSVFVFNHGSGTTNPTNFTNARLNFYSIGSALDLVILDARITALSTAIQAAIAP